MKKNMFQKIIVSILIVLFVFAEILPTNVSFAETYNYNEVKESDEVFEIDGKDYKEISVENNGTYTIVGGNVVPEVFYYVNGEKAFLTIDSKYTMGAFWTYNMELQPGIVYYVHRDFHKAEDVNVQDIGIDGKRCFAS